VKFNVLPNKRLTDIEIGLLPEKYIFITNTPKDIANLYGNIVMHIY